MKFFKFIIVLMFFTLEIYADAVGTPISYQGYLQEADKVAKGSYDMEFRLYDTSGSGGVQYGTTITKTAVSVEDGIFTQKLDFGDVFDGTALWLEVKVRHSGVGNYETLSPRQEITAAPYAQYAKNVENIDSSAAWGSSWSGSGDGLVLESANATGISGENTEQHNKGELGTSQYAVLGTAGSGSNYAGYFNGKTEVNGTFAVANSGEVWIDVQRGNNQNGGTAYKEQGISGVQWIFPYFRGWKNDNLIIRDEAASPKRDVMTFESTTGRIGVNTGTPSALFEVNGDVKVAEDFTLNGWSNMNRPDDDLIGVKYKKESDSATQWIFPYYGAWRGNENYIAQSENMIIYDDTIDRDVMTFQKGTGRVAINQNAANPDAQLDVNGSVHIRGDLVVDGNITHGERVGYLSISAGAWIPDAYTQSSKYFSNNGYIQLRGSDENGHDMILFYAPVYLPDGAKVTQLLAWVTSSIKYNVQLRLVSYTNLIQEETIMASIDSIDNPPNAYHHEINSTISDSVINNMAKAYSLRVALTDETNELVRLHSVRITYTYTKE